MNNVWNKLRSSKDKRANQDNEGQNSYDNDKTTVPLTQGVSELANKSSKKRVVFSNSALKENEQ